MEKSLAMKKMLTVQLKIYLYMLVLLTKFCRGGVRTLNALTKIS